MKKYLAFGLPGLVSVLACSASPASSGGFGGDSGSTTSIGTGSDADTSAASGFSTSTGSDTTSTSSGSPSCTTAATYVYVLTTDNDLYSFQPDKKLFTLIGPLGCSAGGAQPNSMAVDRNAVAWVNYTGSDQFTGEDTYGSVFKVSTADASCTPTTVALTQSWYRLGMGFSSDTQGGDAETLFIAGTGTLNMSNSPGLGKIDTTTGQLTPIGQFTQGLQGQSAELTGTGDARLFGFFTTTPINVAEMDKTTGGVKSTVPLPQVEVPAAWAFSFWGGSFYLYTAPDPTTDPTRTTNVTKYDPIAGTTDTSYMTNIGFTIVGAGVSTCAPTTPPK